jgi:tartrate-resistant acid phosphatase type 5
MDISRISRREVLQGIATTALASATPSVLTATRFPAVHFLVIGDWGRDGAGHQRAVAHEMGKTSDQLAARCVISVGDNFYENGVQSTSDPQWLSSFEAVYSARSLQIPWYVALGNHDYRGLPQAQIDYSKISARWRMPGRYYKVAGGEFGAPQLDLFIIDTSPIAYKDRSDVDAPIALTLGIKMLSRSCAG